LVVRAAEPPERHVDARSFATNVTYSRSAWVSKPKVFEIT